MLTESHTMCHTRQERSGFDTIDMRDPLSCRGIKLSNSMYKFYSSVIYVRLSKWVENSDILVDEQNGFMKNLHVQL